LLGLLDAGARREGVGAEFNCFLGLAGCGRGVLALGEGLIEGAGWLVGGGGAAAFEGRHATATEGQENGQADCQAGG
jgi:hypothetical protein